MDVRRGIDVRARSGRAAGGVRGLVGSLAERYHESFPSFSYGFNSRYPLQGFIGRISEFGLTL